MDRPEYDRLRRKLRESYLDKVSQSLNYCAPLQREARAKSNAFSDADLALERLELELRMAKRRGQPATDYQIERSHQLLSARLEARRQEAAAQKAYDDAFAKHVSRVRTFQQILDSGLRDLARQLEEGMAA